MTVAATNVTSGPYTANGATTVFPFTFSASSAAEVQVLVNSVVVTVGFTISLSSNQSTTPGGSVTFTTAPVNGAIILITSNPSFQQLISFKDSGPFLQSTLDIALDRIARLLLYLKDKLSRAVVFPLGETVSTLPAKSSRLNKYLGFNSSGDFTVLDGTTGDTALRTQLAASNGYTLVGGLPHVVTPQQFGAVADGATDDSAAFVAAIAYLKALALNTGGGGFYKGSPKLFVPAGHYYLGTTTLDINHSLIIEGEGDGWLGPAAFGCSHLRWADGTNGIRTQSPNTSGNTTVDVTTHDGAGGVFLRDLMLEGGFAGTESDHHGLVVRNAVKASNLYIKNFPGEGVKGWAGNVTGNGNVSGNVSTSLFIGVKCEGNRGGIDIRGSDANVVTLINCEGYQNRQFGYLDDNGAGSNTVIGMHCASNGLVTGTWPQTQCSYSGNRYAAKWGGTPTIAPSGDTTDTANWLYIEAGGAIANLIPAWVSTANTFRAGGDYLTINGASAYILNCYSEEGGFSQFTVSTQIEYGSMISKYFRGGTQQLPSNDGGRVFKSGRLNCTIYLDTDGAEAGVSPRNYDGTGGFGYLNFAKGGGASLNGLNGCHFLHNNVPVGDITNAGLSLPAGEVVQINGNQVVGARQTGWAADTGTAKKTANATYTAGATLTYSATYVQAEQTAMATRMAAVEAALQNVSQTQKALKDERLAAGSIGT